MGTKVHYTNYLPGFCTMRDLNEDADGSWSQYHDDKTSGGNLCNGYQLRPSNRHSEYDKEMIKRTMLEHEAVFRKQVYELHRLYRIQKDMMAKMKKDPYRYLQAETSQSNSFSSQVPSEGTNRIPHFLQVSHMLESTTSNHRAPPTMIDRKIPPFDFLKENNLQSGPVSNGKEISLENGDIQDKGNPRRMFDLQLPADVYTDCEEVERLEKEIAAESLSVGTVPHNRIQSFNFGADIKQTFGASEGLSCRENSWKSDLHAQSGYSNRNLADLNEPVGELRFGGEVGSVSANFLGTKSPSKETQQFLSPVKLDTSAFLKGRHYDEGSSSHHMHADGEEPSREWPFFNSKSGQSSRKQFIPGSSKVQSEQIQMNQKPREVFSIDQKKRDTWFKPRLDISRDISAPFPSSSSDNFLKYSYAASTPLLSSWTYQATSNSHETLPVPSLPFSKGIINQKFGSVSNKWQYNNGDPRPDSRLGSNVASYQNDFIRLDYSPPSQRAAVTRESHFGRNLEDLGSQWSQGDFHLNRTLLNGFLDKKVNKGIPSDSSAAPSWLRSKLDLNAPSLMEVDLLQGYPQLNPNSNPNPNPNPILEGSQEKENKTNLINLLDLPPSSFQVKENGTQSNEAANDRQNSRKLFGFTIPEAAVPTYPTDSPLHNEKDEKNVPCLETEAPLTEQLTKSSSSNFRNHINLNSNPNSPEFPIEAEALEVPSQVSAPTGVPMIDLEAMVESQTDNSDETSVREAAESIISISSRKRLHSLQGSFDTLHLLAEVAVVSSDADIVKEASNDVMDEFELETLDLEETKPGEVWCQSSDERYQNDEKSSVALLLFSKHRRGQGRKRRQRREFQRDILPGLASLSRQEVTADLQTIGGLMRASGQPWQAGAKRRNGGRGSSSRGRGGRRPRSSPLAVEEIKVSPPDKPSPLLSNSRSTNEADVDGRSMVAWGRRCRRQRFPAVANVAAPLS